MQPSITSECVQISKSQIMANKAVYGGGGFLIGDAAYDQQEGCTQKPVQFLENDLVGNRCDPVGAGAGAAIFADHPLVLDISCIEDIPLAAPRSLKDRPGSKACLGMCSQCARIDQCPEWAQNNALLLETATPGAGDATTSRSGLKGNNSGRSISSFNHFWQTPAGRHLQWHEESASKRRHPSELTAETRAAEATFETGFMARSGKQLQAPASLEKMGRNDHSRNSNTFLLRRLEQGTNDLVSGLATGPVSLRPVISDLWSYAAGEPLSLAVEVGRCTSSPPPFVSAHGPHAAAPAPAPAPCIIRLTGG
jgi:hypothetical protein